MEICLAAAPFPTFGDPSQWAGREGGSCSAMLLPLNNLTAAPCRAARLSSLEACRILSLVVMLTGTFVAVLDNFIVFVAIPAPQPVC